MPVTPSPLRYPGGKTAITPMVENILRVNKLKNVHYAEPYAGGAGLALSLLFNNTVDEIHLNDLDRSVWGFWHSILNHTDDFIEKIKNTEVTIEEWHKQRAIQLNKNNENTFDLGFSSFFLNRTNRSGIIEKAGVIGGLEQKSKYPLDCRFNKENLIEKIIKISEKKQKIHLYNLDAIEFINKVTDLNENYFFCIDPPYFVKGQSLYTNFYEASDHIDLADRIKKIEGNWILTYDFADFIKELYSEFRRYTFNLNYSAADKKVGTELLVVSDRLRISRSLKIKRVSKKS